MVMDRRPFQATPRSSRVPPVLTPSRRADVQTAPPLVHEAGGKESGESGAPPAPVVDGPVHLRAAVRRSIGGVQVVDVWDSHAATRLDDPRMFLVHIGIQEDEERYILVSVPPVSTWV